jgi:predicted lipid-binding transport protein (Tim44 family)
MTQRWMAWTLSAVMTIAAVGTGFVPTDAEAKRLGGGRSQGMQRTLPPQNAPADRTPHTPAQTPQAAPNSVAPAAATGTAAAAAAAPKRNWMGPIAGLAAGLGIAALMSHLGLGEAFGNFLMLALLAMAGIFLVLFLMRRLGGAGRGTAMDARLQPAGAGAGFGMGGAGLPATSAPLQRQSAVDPLPATAGASLGPVAAASIPADFDRGGFERIAKAIFIRMQTANDQGDLNDLRNFTTPEMFAEIRLDLQERGSTPQHTDVLQIDAEVLEVAQDAERQVVSVRFHGLVREAREEAANGFDEVWHLVKPNDDSRPWAIAGIQQR